jgi:hypothetical protein
MADTNRYGQLISEIFHKHYRPGKVEIEFERSEFIAHAKRLGIDLPKNIGDVLYTFRYRSILPESIRATTPPAKSWVISGVGRSRYKFALVSLAEIVPNKIVAETKVPDATPGIVSQYALTDEQALLARVRYNRLIDIFLGITCYSLQSHLRTSISGIGQLETDELYVGIDRRGAHYAVPVQAKGRRDRLSTVQIDQDFAMCKEKFPELICRPVAAQFTADDLIVLFAFELAENGVAVILEKHYRLVPPKDLSAEELRQYSQRPREEF